MSADQCANYRAGEIKRAEPADFFAIEVQRVGMLQDAADRAGQRDFESIDRPARAERKHDKPMKAAPRQAVESRGNVGANGFHRSAEISMECFRTASVSAAAARERQTRPTPWRKPSQASAWQVPCGPAFPSR